MRRILIYSKVFLLSVLVCVMLTGCGQEQTSNETELKVEKDGSITSVLVEPFDKDFYNLTDLLDMINLELAQYNQDAGAQAIALDSLTQDETNKVTAVMKYQSAADYAAYNETPFFAGTVKEAQDAGVNLDVVLTEAGKEATIDREEILQMEDYRMIVWYEEMPMRVPGKICYYGEGIRLLSSKRAIAETQQSGPFYILYK